jgi:hypothetical protein
MVSLFDEEQPTHNRKRQHSSFDMCFNKANGQNNGQYGVVPGGAPQVPTVKVEYKDRVFVSNTPTYDSDYAESDRDDRRPSKIPKINKDGAPRKPRQPRPKLLKWSDNDWKNVVLGIVWACGETGVQIPFDQAAQVVGKSCTAGALQQAILKLRGKQIDEGYNIPSLRMAWTRKTKHAASSSSNANASPQNIDVTNCTAQSHPSLVVKLKVPDLRRVPVPSAKRAENNRGILDTKAVEQHATFPMSDDLNISGPQGITVINGHFPNFGGSSGIQRDIVKQAVPTQYKQSAGVSFDFDENEIAMGAIDFAEDIQDQEEYDFVGLDSQETLIPQSSGEAEPHCGLFPEMSSQLGHAYDSPYSFLQGEGPPDLHPLLSSGSTLQERQGPLPLPFNLDAGYLPDYPHDVYEFGAGHY